MMITAHYKKFIAWWLQGLAFFCPQSFKRLLGLTPNQITIEFGDEQVLLKHYSVDSPEPLDIHTFSRSDEAQRMSALNWLHEQQEKHAKITLLLPEKLLLKKMIHFPAATLSNLREALGFELNRKTPFTVEQAYFDYLITEHDKTSNKLLIELIVVPRQYVDPLLEQLDEWNVALDSIKPDYDKLYESTINLLPSEQRAETNNQRDHSTLVLASCAFILFLSVLYLPLIQQSRQLASLEDDIRVNRKIATQLQRLKDEKQKIIEQISFLNNKNINTISSILLLNEITNIIPDDTWLTRLVIKNNELQLQGESSNASSLIQIIESSNMFRQAQFRSPVTQNSNTGKDKFHLSAKLVNEGEI